MRALRIVLALVMMGVPFYVVFLIGAACVALIALVVSWAGVSAVAFAPLFAGVFMAVLIPASCIAQEDTPLSKWAGRQTDNLLPPPIEEVSSTE